MHDSKGAQKRTFHVIYLPLRAPFGQATYYNPIQTVCVLLKIPVFGVENPELLLGAGSFALPQRFALFVGASGTRWAVFTPRRASVVPAPDAPPAAAQQSA